MSPLNTSRTLVRYLYEKQAQDRWPVYDSEIDLNLLHWVYLPEHIDESWKAATGGGGRTSAIAPTIHARALPAGGRCRSQWSQPRPNPRPPATVVEGGCCPSRGGAAAAAASS